MSNNKYFPNKWKLVKSLPDEIFTELALPFDEFMEWRVDSWVLPEEIEVLIRATHMPTHKVKEYVYKRKHAAENKVRNLIAKDTHEFVVCTHESIHYVHPNHDIDDDE